MIPLLAPVLVLAFAGLVLTAAAKDAFSFTIPNWISLTLVALFPLAAFASGQPLPAIGLQVGVGAAALVAGMAMFALRWVGGGDAKLLAAVALWMGWPTVVPFLLGMALAGGGLAMMLVLLRSPAMRPMVLLGPPWVTKLAEPGQGVPYGVAIAAGVLGALPQLPLAAGLGL